MTTPIHRPTDAHSLGLYAGPKSLRHRVAKLKARMADWGVDALLVSNAVDIRYLTGFVGDDSWALIPAGVGEITLISDSRFEEQIEREAPHAKPVMREGLFSDALQKTLDRLGFGRVAIQSAHTSVSALQTLNKKLGKRRLKPLDDGLLAQRAVKDAEEVQQIRKSLRIQQDAFVAMRKQIGPGMSEVEVAALLEFEMRRLGADGTSFPTIVAAAGNASLPHAIPGPTKLEPGQGLLIDWGSKFGGYCSDLTRVIGVGGSMPEKFREVYGIVLEAQLKAIEAIAPGKKLADIDAVASKHIEDAGYGEQFGHSLGHGIGLDIHEQPRLSKLAEGVLEVGHVVTVEPGIYLPGEAGVRIEDDVLVTESGHEVLSDLPKDLDWAV